MCNTSGGLAVHLLDVSGNEVNGQHAAWQEGGHVTAGAIALIIDAIYWMPADDVGGLRVETPCWNRAELTDKKENKYKTKSDRNRRHHGWK